METVVITGSSNMTHTYGVAPCPTCGCRDRVTTDFHGYRLTLCVSCGQEF